MTAPEIPADKPAATATAMATAGPAAGAAAGHGVQLPVEPLDPRRPAHIEVCYFGKRRRPLSRTFEFPMSLEQLARHSFDEDAATRLGPQQTHSSQDYAVQDLPRMTADQLLAVLRDALGWGSTPIITCAIVFSCLASYR